MPLDNAKLARAVNTTEKLVKRMDAYCDRRKDEWSEEARKAAAEARRKGGGASSKSKSEYEKKAAANHAEWMKRGKAGEHHGAKEKKAYEKKAAANHAEWMRRGAAGEFDRKDDYGHPVRSEGNHVQQTDYGRGDAGPKFGVGHKVSV